MKRKTALEVAKDLFRRHHVWDTRLVFDDVSLRASKRRAQLRVLRYGSIQTYELGLTWRYWGKKPDNWGGWRTELAATILHEVAHIKVGVDEGHGEKWRRKWIALLRQHFPEKVVKGLVLFCREIPQDWASVFYRD